MNRRDAGRSKKIRLISKTACFQFNLVLVVDPLRISAVRQILLFSSSLSPTRAPKRSPPNLAGWAVAFGAAFLFDGTGSSGRMAGSREILGSLLL
jgi:hypothetical protein